MIRELCTWLFLCGLFQGINCKHRCYVCVPSIGSDKSTVEKFGAADLPLCSKFHLNSEPNEFIRDCPSPKHVGCITQTNGTQMTKSCSNLSINDCKKANNITFCYCKGSLCNKEAVSNSSNDMKAALELSSTTNQDFLSDDDDDTTTGKYDGSGNFMDESTTTSAKTTNSDLRIIDDVSEVPPSLRKVIYTSHGCYLQCSPVLLVLGVVWLCTFLYH